MKPVILSLLVMTALVRLSSVSAAAQVDPTFNPAVDGTVHAVAVLPNGNILIGGEFTQLNETSRANLALLNADGTLNPALTLELDGAVFSLATTAEGAAYVGGAFNSPSRHLLRLAADGQVNALDLGSSTSARIKCFALAPNGTVAFGGPFRRLDGTVANYVGKLTESGAIDASFNSALLPSFAIEAGVDAIAFQADGKLLAGGSFNTSAGATRLVRLNADGSIDDSFSGDHGPMLYPKAILPLADGRILVAGIASSSGDGFVRRLNADGSIDTTFSAPGFSGSVEAIARTEDGEIVVGGNFPEKLMCLREDGSRNADWTITADGSVKALAIQPDGSVVVGGAFTMVGDVRRKGIARVNIKPATQHAFATNANGRFVARLSGEEGAHYEIESSDDLRTWSRVGDVIATAEGIDVSDSQATTRSHRFFRARRVN